MSLIHKLCNALGENNKPIYTVMAVACGKGTVRPILSITDKKEAPDARKYAALRELMTEFIGVPTTFACGLIGESLAGFIAGKGSQAYKNAKAFMSFFGICAAAGFFVPKFCNLGMPPIMKKLMPDYDPNAVTSPNPTATNKPAFGQISSCAPLKNNYYNVYRVKSNSPFYRAGMRV